MRQRDLGRIIDRVKDSAAWHQAVAAGIKTEGWTHGRQDFEGFLEGCGCALCCGMGAGVGVAGWRGFGGGAGYGCLWVSVVYGGDGGALGADQWFGCEC